MHFSLCPPLLALALSTVALAADAQADSQVIELTASDFEAKVNPEPLILVEFFAPWCGHCKALAPHYDEASITLKDKGIKLAKVDCVDQADLCQQHGVAGYPTLKVFRNGTSTDYHGPRQADGIVSYMVKQSLPAVTKVTHENFADFKKADKMVLVAFLDSDSDAPASEFKATAESHRDDYLFGLSTDKEAISAAGVQPPAAVLYRSFDEPELRYVEFNSATSKDLEAFLKENQTPLIDEVSQDNYAIYAQSGLPLAYLFVEPEDPQRDEYIASIKPVAQKYKGKINFVSIDAVKFVDHAKALNLGGDKFPAFVIQDLAKQLKYPVSQEADFSLDTITDWTDLYVQGKLEPVLKSEPIPDSQEEGVYTLVGKTFDSVVFDDKKDVFIEFYAPWCGHCKRLKPVWDSLADRYAEIKDRIVIAKMDATENDLSPSLPFRVSGFPTLKFKPAGTREFVDYDGDRSLESLIEFIEAQAKNSLDTEVPIDSKATSSSKIAAQIPLMDHHDEL